MMMREEIRDMSAKAKKRAVAAAVEIDPRWAAVCARDPSADGKFFYSVRTTGVYCRPSCAARPAKPENVRFHTTRKEAEGAGFRPCKRCKPDQPPLPKRHAAVVTELCRLIESSDELPRLDELARHAGLSTFYLHRLFKAATGVTPRAYAAAHQGKRIRAELIKSDTVTQAIYAANYNSNGRFYAQSDSILGMTPTRYRAGGPETEIRFGIGACSLGCTLVAATTRGVCAILLGDDPEALVRDLEHRFPRARLLGAHPAFEELVAQVIRLVEMPSTSCDLPLDIRGTAFQRRVWEELRRIPAGATTSYRNIAKAIGAPKAARAVAQACAANSLAVAIPCHRVVRADGDLSGYRWGAERKRALLAREEKA
jgi:AraC family transcriptional regulator of adaptative response/methylated-DNA-[protein]-cysteine methyltransferase